MTGSRHPLSFLLIALATTAGLAGTDLVLPAIPGLPAILGGTAERAQLVLASFTAGAAVGLLIFGELGARFDQRQLLGVSLIAYAAVSALCSLSLSLDMLIALRFLQGAFGAAAAVFAPGMLRALYAEDRVVGAMGLLGSIESLAPALAPVAGLWLLNAYGWTAAFDAIAAIALLLAAVVLGWKGGLPLVVGRAGGGGYGRLFVHWAYLRQALSHAGTLGGLLVIVFGAPTVFVASLGAGLDSFILMQMSGVATFIAASMATGRLVRRFGAPALILGGTLLAAVGAVAMLAYALAGGGDITIVILLFLLVNGGLGLRGPPGFLAAIVAADDNARGAALLVVAILLIAAGGTAAVAPFIGAGLVSIATGAAILTTLASIALLIPYKAKPISA